jgi:hypothetical protein
MRGERGAMGHGRWAMRLTGYGLWEMDTVECFDSRASRLVL